MRILQVIHGYPLRYNAGSEVYTQALAQALAERHEVRVFTRQENAFLPEYAVSQEYRPFRSTDCASRESIWPEPGTAIATPPSMTPSPAS